MANDIYAITDEVISDLRAQADLFGGKRPLLSRATARLSIALPAGYSEPADDASPWYLPMRAERKRPVWTI